MSPTWREQRNEVGLRRAAGAAASNGVQLDEVSGTLRSVQNSELKSRDIVIEFCRITAECGWPPARAGITSGMCEGMSTMRYLCLIYSEKCGTRADK